MTDQATRVVPAGWYEDPASRAHVRWWNGLAWTEHTALKPAAAPQQPAQQQSSVPPQSAVQQYGQGAAQSQQGYGQQGSVPATTGLTHSAETAARIAEARELERQYGISTAEHDIIMRRAAEGDGSDGELDEVGSTRQVWSNRDDVEVEYAEPGTATASAWFLALWPVLTLVAISVAGYLAYFVAPTPAVAGIPVVWGLVLVPWLLGIVWAATDARRLTSLGYDAPSPALALLGPLVYLIGRRIKVAGIGPLVTLVVLTAIAVGIPAAAIATGAADRITFALEVQQSVHEKYVDGGQLVSVSCPILVDSIALGTPPFTCEGITAEGRSRLVWVSIDDDAGSFSSALAVR